MSLNYENKHCEIAAKMLFTEPALLDYRLTEYLNELSALVQYAGGELNSRQVIALAIIQWQHDKADDFTKSQP